MVFGGSALPVFYSRPPGTTGTMSTGADESTDYVDHRYIANETIEDREYQSRLVESATDDSTLIALPTGTGKTPVAIRVGMRRIADHGGRLLMLAPTKPLANQHADDFAEMTTIPENEIEVFTGEIRPDKREELWGNAKSVIVATPQVIKNDLVGSRYNLESITTLIFDECHKASGDYAYNRIAERYHEDRHDNRHVLGLSASPGSNKDEILAVCENLGLRNIEVISEDDAVLDEFTGDTETETKWIDMPDELLDAADKLRECYKDAQKPLKEYNVLSSATKDQTFTAIQGAMRDIKELQGSDDTAYYESLSYRAEAMKLHKAIEAVESNSVDYAIEYLEGVIKDGESGDSKAAQRLAQNPKLKDALEDLRSFDGTHPKLTHIAMEVGPVVSDDGAVIVFADGRSTVNTIVEFLNRSDNVTAARFVGQSDRDDDPGMSQTEQQERLDAFRRGEYDVLVSTSVAEEGLDIPAVDLVLFYEPIPSGIRTIQRKGRTGRESDGRVVLLVAKDTGEVGQFYYAQNKVESMQDDMEELKDMEADLLEELRGDEEAVDVADTAEDDADDDLDGQADLAAFDTDNETASSPSDDGGETVDVGGEGDDIEIVMDSREMHSGVPEELDRRDGIHSRFETLDVGDYIVSDRVAVERKASEDFFDTLTGERGFSQIKELANNYSRGEVHIEADGLEDLYGRRNIHPKAIRGALASISVDYNVNVQFTGSEEGTADMLVTLAEREQQKRDREVSLHAEKEDRTLTDKQEYIVSSIPDIGPKTGRALLDSFGSVLGVMSASKSELMDVDGVGEKTADAIRDVVTSDYNPDA